MNTYTQGFKVKGAGNIEAVSFWLRKKTKAAQKHEKPLVRLQLSKVIRVRASGVMIDNKTFKSSTT